MTVSTNTTTYTQKSREQKTREESEQKKKHDEKQLEPQVDSRLQRIWKRAYGARTRDDLKSLYADWAETYDADHEAVGFFGHITASRLLAKYVPYCEVAPVLDAGAGTGAAGEKLAELGFQNLTAIDLSSEMLEQAARKGVYTHLLQADLGWPLDAFPNNHFDAAILVGVFSFGQAPAHALDEMVRVIKPGGVVVFTMRTDFYESDAMGVRSRIEELEDADVWQLAEITDPEKYLPKKDPNAMFRVWCYRVLKSHVAEVTDGFAEAVGKAMSSQSCVKRIDHCYIWNSTASRLYDRYIECPEYYLPDCELDILRTYADEIVRNERNVVELGCGSALKVKHILEASLKTRPESSLTYTPIDLSKGALISTQAEIDQLFAGRVKVDPRQGHFNDLLPTIPNGAKVIFFFGGSIGNIETLEATVRFLKNIRDCMTPRDRFIVGMDLDKEESILRSAYEAGPRNRSFFLNMLRRINNQLGANFDLSTFQQESTYDSETPYQGVENKCVNLKLVTQRQQTVFISKLNMDVHLNKGDAIQVGTSRKFREKDIARLFSSANLRLHRQWFDRNHYLSMNECMRDDAVH